MPGVKKAEEVSKNKLSMTKDQSSPLRLGYSVLGIGEQRTEKSGTTYYRVHSRVWE